MASGPTDRREEQVLVLAPSGRDAHVAVELLERSGVRAHPCHGWDDLFTRLRGEVGALLIAQEAVTTKAEAALADYVAAQPAWSDLPIVLLTSGAGDADRAPRIVKVLRTGNVTLLERPFRVITFTSVIQTALRSRRRQYQVRELFRQREDLLESERAARADAEIASRMKDEFLAGLSHELRTPLNAILGWCQLLRMGGMDDEELEQGLEIIERNSRLQAELINDLLDLSRIISGKLRLDMQQVNLGEIVEAALASVLPSAEAKGVDLQWHVDPAAGPVMGDTMRLQQVVWNLLSNAIKFTAAGGRVEALVEKVGEAAQICVRDTGMGISADFLPYVFDRFRQADGSTTRRHGGLGLGLSIVRHIVELHGGTVHVASDGEGQGATFCVDLPIGAATDSAAPKRRLDRARKQGRTRASRRLLEGLRVLVVDDDADARTLLKRMLGERGAAVEAAESAPDALQKIDGTAPDLLISDIGMPGQDGYDLIREIRTKGLDADRLPAVALTAFARNEDAERALEAGFQIHMSKPINARELTIAVATLAGRT